MYWSLAMHLQVPQAAGAMPLLWQGVRHLLETPPPESH